MAFPADIDHKHNSKFVMNCYLYDNIENTGTIGSFYREAALVRDF